MTASTDVPDDPIVGAVDATDPYLISLDGEVDMARAAELVACVEGFKGSRNVDVRVDMAGVTFMDSTGLSALAHLRSIAAERGGSAVLVRPPTGVIKLLQIVAFDSVFTIEK